MAKANKNKKKRLKSLVLLLFLTLVLLTTSTYAWFTANKTVAIEPIDVRVATSTGLQISVDASEWKTLVSVADIKAPANWTSANGNKNQVPTELSPVSTTGGATSGYLNFYKGTVEGNTSGALALYTEKSADEAFGTSGDFIAFDIFLKLDGATQQAVYLDNNSGVTVTTDKADKGLQYAARYAFLYEGRVASTTESKETYQALTGGSNTATIIEPNYDGHKTWGYNQAAVYNQTITNEDSSVDMTTKPELNNNALSYYGVKGAIAQASMIVLPETNPGGTDVSATYFESPATLYKTNTAYSTGSTGKKSFIGNTLQTTPLLKLFDLQPGVSKFRVYMWIEGQDVDCENSASGAELTYKLGLTLNQE